MKRGGKIKQLIFKGKVFKPLEKGINIDDYEFCSIQIIVAEIGRKYNYEIYHGAFYHQSEYDLFIYIKKIGEAKKFKAMKQELEKEFHMFNVVLLEEIK